MGSNSEDRNQCGFADNALKSFIERAVAVGIDDIKSLGEILPDQKLQEKILAAAAINPVIGRAPSIDDLINEIRFLEKLESADESAIKGALE